MVQERRPVNKTRTTKEKIPKLHDTCTHVVDAHDHPCRSTAPADLLHSDSVRLGQQKRAKADRQDTKTSSVETKPNKNRKEGNKQQRKERHSRDPYLRIYLKPWDGCSSGLEAQGLGQGHVVHAMPMSISITYTTQGSEV